MTITELIAKLEAIKEREGDLVVCYACECGVFVYEGNQYDLRIGNEHSDRFNEDIIVQERCLVI